MRRNNGSLYRLLATVALPLGLIHGLPSAMREVRTGPADPIDPTTRFEPRDVNARAVFLTGAGLLAGLWVVVLLTYPIFAGLNKIREKQLPPPTPAQWQIRIVPPPPRLQANPRRDWMEMRSREERELTGYGWVDRAHGVVSIPIDRAMQIVAARGIPPRPAPGNQTYFNPRAGTRQTGFEGKVEPEPR